MSELEIQRIAEQIRGKGTGLTERENVEVATDILKAALSEAKRQGMREAAERVHRLRPSDLTGRGDYDTGHAHGLLNAEEVIRALEESHAE